MAKKPMTVSDRLRQAVERSELTRYKLSQLSGISQSVLSRFVGGAGLNSDNLDRLAEVLEMELRFRESKGV